MESAWHRLCLGLGSVSHLIPKPKKETRLLRIHKPSLRREKKNPSCFVLPSWVLLISSGFSRWFMIQKQSCNGLNTQESHRLQTQLGVFAFAPSRINVQQEVVWSERRGAFQMWHHPRPPPPPHPSALLLCLLHSWGEVGGTVIENKKKKNPTNLAIYTALVRLLPLILMCNCETSWQNKN